MPMKLKILWIWILFIVTFESLVEKILNRFGQDKLIIMGHSWGSIIGAKYAQEHSDKIQRYIGIGQVWDSYESEELTTNQALEMAKEKGNSQDIEKMQVHFSSLKEGLSKKEFRLEDLMKLREISLGKYLVSKSSDPFYISIWKGLTSPKMNIDDMKCFFKNSDTKEYHRLFEKVFIDFQSFNLKYAEINMPVTIIMGEEDWITPYVISQKYIDSLKAPSKYLFIIEKAGHAPYLDKAEEFANIIKAEFDKFKNTKSIFEK